MSTSSTNPAAPTGDVPAIDNAFSPQWLSHKQVLTIIGGLIAGMFLAALDQMIVGTAIVKIANDLNGFHLQAWITTAYLITSTIATPIYGKISDIYGRKPLYLTAITIFLIGSAASAFADSIYQLAIFRAVQGLGAGGLMSLAMTIIGDIVPPRERARYQGYFLATFGLATVLGPVLGGVFADLPVFVGLTGWRWVFLVNVPIGLIALFVVAKVLNVPHEKHSHRIDWWGGLMLTVTVVPLLIVAEQGNEWGWDSQKSLICYGIGAVGLILFLIVERIMKDEAIIPLRLFNNPTFTVAIIGGVIVGIAMFGGMTMIPQYMQVVQGYSPTEAGLLMLPVMAGIVSGSIISGRVTEKTGRYKVFPIIGTFLIALGCIVFAQVNYDSALWHPLIGAFIIGLGLGGCMQTLIIAAQNAGPRADMGVSTATATFSRQIGGTIGVAVFLTILFNVLPGNINAAFGGNPPAGAGSQLADLQSNTSMISSLPDAIQTPVLIGFTDSITTVFYAAAGVALLAFIVLWFMKEIPLTDGAPAASMLEGGEALIDEDDEKAKAEVKDESTKDDRDYQLVSAVSTTSGDTGVLNQPRMSLNGFSDTDQSRTLSGYIHQPDGRTIADVTLTLIDHRGRQVAKTTGRPDGGYTITAPGEGTYVLIVSASGHQPQASSVVLTNARAEALDITLVGSGELSGTVVAASSGNSEKTVVVDATVTLTDRLGEVTGTANTSADGSYRFQEVAAGNYTLVANAENFRPSAVTLSVPDSGTVRHDIELAAAVLLTGTARTEGNRIVPDARITVLNSSGEVAAVTRTDTSGRYVVSDLPEGNYTVVASGYPPATSAVTLATGHDATHDVRLGYQQIFDELESEYLTGEAVGDRRNRSGVTSATGAENEHGGPSGDVSHSTRSAEHS